MVGTTLQIVVSTSYAGSKKGKKRFATLSSYKKKEHGRTVTYIIERIKKLENKIHVLFDFFSNSRRLN